MTDDSVARRRREARELARQGRIREAIPLLEGLVAEGSQSRDDHALLGLYHFNAGAPREAAEILIDCHRRWPEDQEILNNIGVCLSRGGDQAGAKTWLLRAVARDPEDANLHDALASTLGRLGERAAALRHGARALMIKDRIAAAVEAPHDPQSRPVPPFAADQPARNVIAFSLWGTRSRYLEGALANARLAPHIYPGWRCRFHVDASVPERLVGELLASGADVVTMPDQQSLFEGLFWRFLPVFDPALDRVLVRDADAVISLRERLAVDRWLESGRHFHVLRDGYTHTDPILAGLWGAVAGALPDLSDQFAAYLGASTKTANCDQKFLRDRVWPIARQSALIHDSHYEVLGAEPFPPGAGLPAGRHVGQDASIFPVPPAGRRSGTRRRHFLFTITPGRSGTAYLTKLLQANCPEAECHHERTGFARMGAQSPDASTFMLFNSEGNTPEVRAFWRKKFALIRHGAGERYFEVSHYLAKAGLIENLAQLGPDAEIDIIDLRRDVFDIVWSTANRFDFANNGFTWLFALDPGYPRRILDPAPLKAHGMPGLCLWYVAEMFTRAEYYRRLLAERSNVRVHRVDLETISTAPGATAFLHDLGLMPAAQAPRLPPKTNASTARPLGEAMKAEVQRLVERFTFDPSALAEEFIHSGRRLA